MLRAKSAFKGYSMKKLWDEPLTEGEMELLLYKFKQWLGSVGREIQNRQLKNISYQGDDVDCH